MLIVTITLIPPPMAIHQIELVTKTLSVLTVLSMLTQVNQSQMEIRNCGVTIPEMMWMTI